MDQTDKFLRLRLAGQESDLSAVADAESRCDALVVLKLDALLVNKFDQPVEMAAHFAGDAVLELRKIGPGRLGIVLSRDSRPGFYRSM